MTAICKCQGFPGALPLEHDGKFYCGSCGGLYEGIAALVAKNMWTTTGRINDEVMAIPITVSTRVPRIRRTRKGRTTLAKRHK
jgi:hypothetical protein